MPIAPGSRLGPYEILDALGAGGMGEVYLASDSRLGREVAVKVITGRLGDDPAALARFEREARSVAALNHPNILSIHDYGREGNVAYAVMELLEGETLQQRLARGPLPVSMATDIAGQISRGLTAAHEKGITHRDLKPANVFLTQGGHVKILDFGLARVSQPLPAGTETLSHASTAEALTHPGAVMGTVGYMAPEQVRGEAVDARTDLFALGCLLHEMLAGRRPFERGSAMDTLAAILKEDPPPLPSLAPPALDRLVRQCLEKRQADRFSSAHDVALALQAVSASGEAAPAPPPRSGGRDRRLVMAGAVVAGLAMLSAWSVYVFRTRPGDAKKGGTRPPRIVVLPFENLGAPEDAYFAAGMAEEITSRLANVRGLGVISRTSAMGYDRKGKNVRQVGSDLGVDYVLEGSIRWERGQGRESRVRITPQLIRVADDTHVWSDRYDRVIADVFAIQAEVAENAVRAMGVTLLPRERGTEEATTGDLQAYDSYLRGQEAATRGDRRQDIEESGRMFQAAVDRDPRFARALAGLARSHLRMYWYHFDRSPERLALAREAAERAVALGPELAETHTALGEYFYMGLLDFPPALREFSAALAIQPSSSPARAGKAYVMRRQGRWAEAADALASAVELDPRNATILDNLGLTYIFARRYADADRVLGRAVALSPKWAHPYTWKAWLQVLWHGDVSAARAILDEGPEAARSMDDGGTLAGIPLWYSLLPREYPAGLEQLEADPPKSVVDGLYSYWPLPLLRGEVERLAGRQDASRREFEAAGLELERKVAQDPGDARVHSALGVVYAGLGRRREALREANRGCELMPSTRDAAAALQRSQDLAQVHVMLGQTSEAIAVWEGLLARSGVMTTHLLTLDPRWEPLRPDPGFQALLRKYEVKP